MNRDCDQEVSSSVMTMTVTSRLFSSQHLVGMGSSIGPSSGMRILLGGETREIALVGTKDLTIGGWPLVTMTTIPRRSPKLPAPRHLQIGLPSGLKHLAL